MMQQRDKGDPAFRMSESRRFEGLSRRAKEEIPYGVAAVCRAKERLLGGVAAVRRAKQELRLEDEAGCRVQEIMPGGAEEWHSTTDRSRRATEAAQTTTGQPRGTTEAVQTTTRQPRRATEATLDTTFPPRHSAEAGRKVKQEPRRAPHSHPAETENHRG